MDDKPISAGDIVKNPELVYQFTNYYILIRDTSMMATYRNLIEAINLMAERGWETVSIAGGDGGNMFALCRNTRFKFKNQPADE